MNRNFVTFILIIRPGRVLHHFLIDSLFMKAHNKSKPQPTNINEELATLNIGFCSLRPVSSFFRQQLEDTIMEAQSSKNDLNSSMATGHPQENTLRRQKCRLLRLTPLLCVAIGAILTVVGQVEKIQMCQIGGPVVMAVGGVLLLFIILCNSRSMPQDHLSSDMSCEQGINTRQPEGGAKDELKELGAIHQFEFCVHLKPSSCEDILPPSYDDAVKNNTTESLKTLSFTASDKKELSRVEHKLMLPSLCDETAIKDKTEVLKTGQLTEND